MKKSEINILNKMHGNHRILIDEITKIYNAEMTTVTRVCTVIRHMTMKLIAQMNV